MSEPEFGSRTSQLGPLGDKVFETQNKEKTLDVNYALAIAGAHWRTQERGQGGATRALMLPACWTCLGGDCEAGV
jgi:hypothetical protein